MNSDDYEALKKVVELAESDVMHHECEEMPMLEEKAAIKTIKEGILAYLKTCDDLISGKLDIQFADG